MHFSHKQNRYQTIFELINVGYIRFRALKEWLNRGNKTFDFNDLSTHLISFLCISIPNGSLVFRCEQESYFTTVSNVFTEHMHKQKCSDFYWRVWAVLLLYNYTWCKEFPHCRVCCLKRIWRVQLLRKPGIVVFYKLSIFLELHVIWDYILVEAMENEWRRISWEISIYETSIYRTKKCRWFAFKTLIHAVQPHFVFVWNGFHYFFLADSFYVFFFATKWISDKTITY